MTAQQRRKRRMIRRFAPTVALCAVIAIIAAACVCALARPAERDTQPEAASTETVAAVTKIAPAITKAAEQITKTPETITPEVPEETEPEEQPEEAPEEISRYAALNVTEDDIDMLAALAWHEARGEPFDGQVAVVLTALNRCLSPDSRIRSKKSFSRSTGTFGNSAPRRIFGQQNRHRRSTTQFIPRCTTQITFFPPKRYFSAQRHTTTISLQSSEITSFVLLRR